MNNRNSQSGGHGQCRACTSPTQQSMPAGAGMAPQQMNQQIPMNGQNYGSNGYNADSSICSRCSSQSSCAQSQPSQGGLSGKNQDAAGIVKEMDEKFNKFRKKIQKDSSRSKRCQNFQDLLSKPPWTAPEPRVPRRPLKERNCRPPPEPEPDAQSMSGNDCCSQVSNQQMNGGFAPGNQDFNQDMCGTGNEIDQNFMNGRMEQQNQVAGHETGYCGCTNGNGTPPYGEMAGGCGGYEQPQKSQKPKDCSKLKKFSKPADLRKKLNQYFENKTDDKNNPIGSFVPFYDGTIDLSSCLTRGAKEGLEPWELGNLVCEHPGANSGCGSPQSDCNSQSAPQQSQYESQGQSGCTPDQEVECFKKIMPPNLTCQQQIDYIQCMGGTEEVIRKFRATQECNDGNGFQGPDLTSPKENSICKPCEGAAEMQFNGQSNQVNGGEEENNGRESIDYQALDMFGPPFVPPKRTMAETFKLYKDHLSNIRRRYFGEVVKHIDDVEDITPETAAAMVITEEQGMTMKTAPAKLYEFLYPESPSQPLLKIGEVASPDYLPENVNNIVVPLVPPMMLETEQYPGLEDPAMLDSPRVIQIGPSMNLADEPGISEGTKPADIVEAVMGQADVFYPEEDEDEEEEGGGDSFDFDVKLHQAMPPHYSRFQLRGSQAPNWFPGYYVAMPSRFGVIVQEKVGNVLERAWEETQPETIKPRDGATIIGY